MSAAATAAGYLYASGRLRGRASREGADPEQGSAKRRDIKVAVYPSSEHRDPQQEPHQDAQPQEQAAAARPVRVPKIQYRTRRWKPE